MTFAQDPAPDAGPGAPIRLRIQHINQLFHTLDPFPFRERDLDAQAEEYIVSWAREIRTRGRLTISIHMPAAQANSRKASATTFSLARRPWAWNCARSSTMAAMPWRLVCRSWR